MGAVQSVEDGLLHPAHWSVALPAAALRQVGVADLLSPLGLDFESYGTARMMARAPHEERLIAGTVHPPPGAEGGLILECLPAWAIGEFEATGLSLRAVDGSVPAATGVLRPGLGPRSCRLAGAVLLRWTPCALRPPARGAVPGGGLQL